MASGEKSATTSDSKNGAKKLSVDVFGDIVCPWCFIGTERLERVLAKEGIEAEVTHHPFFLDPNTPVEGVNIHEKLKGRFGGDIGAMLSRVEAEAKLAGITLDLSKQPNSYSTAAAHTLMGAALPKGTQRALAKALYTAHFLEARRISDPDVLVDIATKHGFTAEEARAVVTSEDALKETRDEAAEASAMGIRGVPFFLFNERIAVPGAEREEVLSDAIKKARQSPA